MIRSHVISTVAAKVVMGWIASIAAADGFHGSSDGPGKGGDDFMVKDPMRDDEGYIAWDSAYDFSERGMSPFGIVARDFKKMPSQFDASVTVDASKSAFWGFGVAGRYSPKAGYSGIGFAASADSEIGVVFARWERDSIVDMARIDVDAATMMHGVHRITISVRDDVAFAAIDDRVVGQIGYSSKYSGSQVVFASFPDGATSFRDMAIAGTVPTPGAAAIMTIAGMMVVGGRRRR